MACGCLPPEPCRSAWCYGDPGIAAALLSAARASREVKWEKEALAIARTAAKRPPDQAGVIDAGLCHGAAGLGHIFNRLFQATGEALFKKAAQFWFQRTLELRHTGKGISGFSSSWPLKNGKVTWRKEPGLLTGAAGIGLALLAATTSVRPDWDRMLLTSIESKTEERHDNKIKHTKTKTQSQEAEAQERNHQGFGGVEPRGERRRQTRNLWWMSTQQ